MSPAKLEDALAWSAREHAREEERQRRLAAEEAELLGRYETIEKRVSLSVLELIWASRSRY